MRKQYATSHRRSAALLLALATLVLAVSATAVLARAAATAKAEQRAAGSIRLTQHLLPAIEAPIIHWLETRSKDIVLPSDVSFPDAAVAVLNDQIETNSAVYELTITAYDECGRAPLLSLRSASPLRSAVPVEVLQEIDATPELVEPVGLDSLGAASLVDVNDWMLFPRALRSDVLRFGSVEQDERSDDDGAITTTPPVCLGTFVSTHSGDPPVINVNTAPLPLIESALRLAGRGGLEQIAAARDAGEPTSVGALPQFVEPQSSAPVLRASSHAWGFRIDVRAENVVRSWWAVYVKDESPRRRVSKSIQDSSQVTSAWRCVQRCAIVE